MNYFLYFGIPVIRFKDYEGDDLIYFISTITRDSIVLSDDKDLIQLIQDYNDNTENRRCRIYRPLREEFWDKEKLQEEYSDVNEFISRKCIIGDPSDNIPSCCAGVGDKTSKNLYELYSYTSKNNIKFPENEKELEEISKKINLKPRKAYLNFNENQYLINYLMTNLYLFEKDEEIFKQIIEKINSRDVIINIDSIKTLLNEYEIHSFNYEELFNRVNSLNEVIDIEKMDSTSNIVEQNNNNNFLF